jgi:6-phosphogluconolactonase
MIPNLSWTRRTFVSTLSLTGAAAMAGQVRSLDLPTHDTCPARAPFLAFVGFPGGAIEHRHTIESYRVKDGTWTAINSLFAESPRSLALHPQLPILYVAHSTAIHHNLPRGSVSSYAIDDATGSLSHLSRQPLALSATYPSHLAVSPDGRTLLASATGGGAYNFFTLGPDGAILSNPYALKQTGSGPHPLQRAARPHTALFQKASSSSYATDLGADRLNQIAFEDAVPIVRSRLSFVPGCGPAHLVLHPSGELLLVANRFRPAISVVPVDATSGDLRSPFEHYPLGTYLAGPIALGNAGDRVYATGIQRNGRTIVSVFALAHRVGKLRLIQQTPIDAIAAPEQLLRHDNELLFVGAAGVVSLSIARRTGLLGEPKVALLKGGAASLAVRTT